MIYVTNATTRTVTQYVTDATDPGKDALYTPPDPIRSAQASPKTASAAPAADKDCD
jgi:hypothetical protein